MGRGRRRATAWAALAAGLGAIALLLGGCTNDPYPSSERGERILYAALGDDPKTLDPSVVYNITDGVLANAVYVSYFQYHYLKRNPFELQLALGAEMPKRERYPVTVKGKKVEGERWTFRIKRGLRFQDDPCFPGGKGREIVASDFLNSFKRMADPAVQCPILAYLEDKVIGFDAYHQHQRDLAKANKPADTSFPLPGFVLDPKDQYTFRIVLNQPYPQLRYLMAMTFTTPLAPEATQKYGKTLATKHMVGEGPYMLKEWLPKQRIVFVRNRNYRQDDYYPSEGMPGDKEKGLLDDAGKQLPLNDGVIFSIIKENLTGWTLFLQGYLDSYGVNQQNYTQAVSRVGTVSPPMAAHGITLRRVPGPSVYYFAFNMKDALVGGYGEKQRKLRQALSLAYDAGAELDLEDAGLGQQAQWLVPPSIFSYDPNYRNPYRQTSIERAKELLAQAGYPDGVDPSTGGRLQINYDNADTDAAGREFVAFVQKQFAQIGVDLVSKPSRPEVWDEIVNQKGQYQMASTGWIADYPDPENFVFLLYGPNIRPGPNVTAYDNPQYNALFRQMRAMDDTPQRAAIIDRMRAIAVEDCPVIFRIHPEDLYLVYPWIHNYQPHPIALDNLKYRRVDPAMRRQLQERWNRPFYLPIWITLAVLLAGTVPAVYVMRMRGQMTARSRSQL